jgi:hypothetical protein
LFVGKPVDFMLNQEVFLAAQIHKAVITSPIVRMNNASGSTRPQIIPCGVVFEQSGL